MKSVEVERLKRIFFDLDLRFFIKNLPSRNAFFARFANWRVEKVSDDD
jgi:hypothetical protein